MAPGLGHTSQALVGPDAWIVQSLPKKSAPSGAPLGLGLWGRTYFANSSHQPEPTPSTIQRRPQFRSE
jgi:hypothetical protein